jgi:type VI secretion system VgrG family protein
MQSASKADLLFQVDGGPTDKYKVASFEGVEGISVPFRFDLELVSNDHGVDLDGIVGKPGLLTIAGPAGKRYVHGIISRMEYAGRKKDSSTYRAELVPEIWLMSLQSDCRIFQEKDVKTIVEEVLDASGIVKDRFEFSLKGSYPKREFCVQYRESNLDFISRLLEEEGIYYFFEHTSKGHKMVMADANEAAKKIEGEDELAFRPTEGRIASEEFVDGFGLTQDLRTGKTTLQDFDYLKPAVNLEASEQASRDTSWESYDFPGLYVEPGEGKRLAKVRIEQAQTSRIRARGSGTCRRMMPGTRFTLKEHSRKECNQEYILGRVHHEGDQPQVRGAEVAGDKGRAPYSNTFECIPAKTVLRPERLTPRPHVHGSHTATVVGPSGEEVHMDEHGRAKVQFHWDREGKKDEKSSCWVRVSQGYAGPNHGMQFPPLIGDEVVVDFLEGDPDRPLIVGRVYNADNPPPLKPDERIQNVVLTPYQHRMLMDDKKMCITLNTGGSETIHMGDAQEDPDYGNNVRITTNEGHTVQLAEGDQHKGVVVQTKTEHKIELRDEPDPGIFLVDQNGSIYLHLDTANKTINIVNDESAEINVKCAGGTVNLSAGSLNLDAEGKVSITGGSEIELKAPNIKADADANFEAKGGTGAKLEGSAQVEVKGGMATFEGSGMGTVKAGGILTVQGSLVKIN